MNAHLAEQLRGTLTPGIIAVSGFGGSGKSTLAAEIGRLLDAPVISVDSFIKDRRLTNYSQWGLIDYERLEREVLAPFPMGAKPIEFGHFDWNANAVTSRRALTGCSRIVVEGVGLFRPELRRYFAFAVWVRCPLEEAIRRGKKRDREVYNNPQDESWDGVWRRNDEEYARLYRPEEAADAVYDNSAADD